MSSRGVSERLIRDGPTYDWILPVSIPIESSRTVLQALELTQNERKLAREVVELPENSTEEWTRRLKAVTESRTLSPQARLIVCVPHTENGACRASVQVTWSFLRMVHFGITSIFQTYSCLGINHLCPQLGDPVSSSTSQSSQNLQSLRIWCLGRSFVCYWRRGHVDESIRFVSHHRMHINPIPPTCLSCRL